MKPHPNTKPHFIIQKNPKNPRNKLHNRKPGRALKNSPVDCFSEGASWRAGNVIKLRKNTIGFVIPMKEESH